ncbi:MAG: rhodanese-like domain-containing protein [Phycisphaerales bacterium]|nr:rhodanese-like domain-containing protein [Phycisphaerales bacterium]
MPNHEYSSSSSKRTDPWELSGEELLSMQESDAPPLLLDCRTTDEFNGGHLHGATCLALQQLSLRMPDLEPHRAERIVVYCRTGRRSRIVARYLSHCGFNHVWSLASGIEGWTGPTTTDVQEH